MGKIFTPITITNRVDQVLAQKGLISPEEVRSITLARIMVDTGATTLCLPSELVAQLGLEFLRDVDVATAAGLGKVRLFQDAKISLYGREGTFECLELPSGTEPLLGVIPMEALGLELDLQNQRVTVLPMGPSKTYLTIL